VNVLLVDNVSVESSNIMMALLRPVNELHLFDFVTFSLLPTAPSCPLLFARAFV
jgi:hypothetical protein